ncbi:MAG: hypothetical protein AAB680_05240 [Pseudomonadota bacterium]|mgnify:CR=1 FL=1
MVKLNKIEDAISASNKSGASRLVLMFGPDFGMISRKMNHFAAALKKENPDLELRRFSENDLANDFEGFENSVLHNSLFGGANIGRLRLGSESQSAKLIDFVSRYDDVGGNIGGAVLIEAGDISPTNKLVQAFEKSPFAWVIRLYDSSKQDLIALMKAKAADEGVRIDQEAIDRLLEFVPNDVDSLLAEVENLALFVGLNGKIDSQAIVALSIGGRDADLSEITNSAFLGETRILAIKLNQALENGQSPIAIYNAIMRRLRLLLSIHVEAERGSNIDNIVKDKKLGVFWKEQSSVARQAKIWQRNFIEDVLSKTIEADSLSKRRDAPADAILERLLNRICARAARVA